MADTTHVKGLDELQKLLDTLPAKMEANVMRGALRAGMNPIKAEAKQLLAAHGNVVSGQIRDGLKVSVRSQGGKILARLRVRGKHAFIAYWLEFTGAKPHEIKPKKRKSLFIAGLFGEIVHHPGFRPKPFLRPALDGQAQRAVIAVGEYIKNRLATKNGLDTSGIDIEAGEGNAA